MLLETISPSESGAQPRVKMNAAITRVNKLDEIASGLVADVALSAEVAPAVGVLEITRPGDGRAAFTTTLAGGPAELLPVLPADMLSFGSEGAEAVLANAGIVARRGYTAVEPGRAYRVRTAVRRRANVSDPTGDATVCGIAWYDQAKTPLPGAAATSTANSFPNLTTGDGRQEVVKRLAFTASADVDLVIPANARYGRAYGRTYGVDGLTALQVLDLVDTTERGVMPALSAAFESRVAAQESLNVGPRLNLAEAALSGTLTLTFPTRTDAAAATIPVSTKTLVLLGRVAAGDGGAATYSRSTSGTGLRYFQSADGAYWKMIGDAPDLRALGATTGATDNSGVVFYAFDNFPAFSVEGSLPITDKSAISTLAKAKGEGNLKIGANIMPVRTIRQDLTLHRDDFTSIFALADYLNARDFAPNIAITMQLAAGDMNLGTQQFIIRDPKWRQVHIRGASTALNATFLKIDNTSNRSAIAVLDGGKLGSVDWLGIQGVNGRTGAAGVNTGTWSTAGGGSYGAAILVAGAGSEVLRIGSNVRIYDFYYAVLGEMNAAFSCDPGVEAARAGDCAFHTRQGGVGKANGCKVFGAAHYGPGLGFGFGTEDGSKLWCQDGYATGCAYAAVVSQGGSNTWAHGFNAVGNTAAARAVNSGELDLGYNPITNRATILADNGAGVVIIGGRVAMGHTPTYVGLIEDCDFDAVNIDEGGQFLGSNLVVRNNGGFSMKATKGSVGSMYSSTRTGNASGNTPFADASSHVFS